jgi:hypothetical protein
MDRDTTESLSPLLYNNKKKILFIISAVKTNKSLGNIKKAINEKGWTEKVNYLALYRLVTNLKEKKFKRGASTISMQLVKNVFLNRNKTVVRKVEEIILVWLMESSKQVSKKRLYEVYLNVIEWGNNVYGITEAARYYFGKKPVDLNLGESIFLSSIVPRPKTGLYSFDWTGHLKSNMMRYFNTYGSIMVKTGQIGVDSTVANYGFYQVQLVPQLRSARPTIVDTAQTDELNVEEGDDVFLDLNETTEEHKRSMLDKLLGRNREEDK